MLSRHSESYMPWNEYITLIERRSTILFIDATARKSLKNHYSKKEAAK